MAKIKLSHTEVEVKTFLEVLAVYGVLALVLVGVYYLEPAITGFVTVTKEFNYTDEVNLEFGESSEFVWDLANSGNLKSVKISGSMIKQGKAKVYIENNGIRYLIFDSSKLVERPSGIFGITGFAVLDKKKDEIKTEIKGTLNDEQQELFDLLVSDINKTRNNVKIEIEVEETKAENNNAKVKKKIKGYVTDLQNELINNLSLSLENSTEKIKIKIEGEFEEEDEEINNAPVWNSDVESFNLNGKLSINLSLYFYDADNDLLTYSSGNVSNVSINVNNEIITLIPDENIDDSRQIILAAYDNTNITFKTVSLIIKTIGEVPINGTITNETVEKIININLEYGGNEIYDANNDGVESLGGVIDFSVNGSDFNWAVDDDKLCTRYEIFSVENQESTFACFGADDCCALVELQSSRDSWNDELFLSYGGYGSSADNIVFAQVLYANYSLNIDEPYSEIVYSSWDNLTAKFSADIIKFESICIDTCMFSGNETSYKLVIEAENTTLWIDKIKYLVEEKVANNDPVLVKQIENISVFENEEYILDLNEYFFDGDNDELAYSYYEIENLTIRFENDLAYIVPDEGFTGSRLTSITADDSFGQAVSNVFKIDVNAEVLSIEIVDSRTARDNWTIGFSTTGTGNLTISAISGSSYAEFYNDNISTVNDLDILELRCGDFEIFDKAELIETEGVWFILMNGSKVGLVELIRESLPISGLYIENYNCNDIGYYTVKVAGGASTLGFNFSNEIKNVGYEKVIVPKYFEIRGSENENLAVFDDTGNLRINGNLTQNIVAEADGDDFVIQDSAGGVNVVVTNPEGNMQIKGVLNENQSMLLPTPNSFIIQDKNGNAVAYVNDDGSLFLKGTLTNDVVFE
jgi:hypothetical protein